jgi:hypothetical protein
MSTQPEPKRKRVTKTRRTGSDALRNSLPGIALVLASVLPSALSPSPGGKPPGAAKPAHKAAPAFKAGCKLPFDKIKTEGLEIDARCSEDGIAAVDDTKTRLEMNAKNNFCADGPNTPITYEDLKNLQTTSEDMGLKKTLKTSRASLSRIFKSAAGNQIGEGSLVQLVAFVGRAKNSNKGTGEIVNCKLPAVEENDIHIELTIDRTDDDPCNSVSAEMSPHFRPEAWNELVNLKLERPVRITGQLFFDNSHAPCHDNVRPTPNRISVWEIHPVYQFEICKDKTLAACDVRKDSQWIPLDQWHSGDEETEP